MAQAMLSVLEEKVFTEADMQELVDELLDRLRVDTYTNPIIDFLAQKTGYPIDQVEAAFRFMKYLGRFSNMPFSNLLRNSTPGSDFWWDLFKLYDTEKIDNGYSDMLKILTT